MQWFDAHVHAHRLAGTDSSWWPDRLLCCGTQLGDWDAVGAWCRAHPGAVAAYGMHPWHADQWNDAVLADLEQRLQADATAGVGEIGLHYAKPYENRAAQEACFMAQLKLGCDYGRTISMHCVRAWGGLLACLDGTDGLGRCRVLVHDYSGSAEVARELVARGVFLSCRPSSARAKLAAVVRTIDPRFLLVETDAGGKADAEIYEVKMLEDALAQLAAWRGDSVETLRAVVWENGERFLR